MSALVLLSASTSIAAVIAIGAIMALLRTHRRLSILESAVDALADGFVLYDNNDRVALTNRRYRELHAANELAARPGTRFEDLFRAAVACGEIPVVGPDVETLIGERLALHNNPSGAIERRSGDLWLRISEHRTRDGSTVGIHADVTALKTAQGSAEAARERMSDFAEASNDWFWEADDAGNLTYLSEPFEAATGISVASRIGALRLDLNLALDPDNPDWDDHLRVVTARQPFRDFVMQVQFPRGARHLSVSGKPLFDRDGRFLGYRGTTRNVTAEIEGQRTRARLLDAVNSIPDGFQLWDKNERLILYNPSAFVGVFPSDAPPPPGISYREVLERVVRSGKLPITVGHEEEFIEAALYRHRAVPSGQVEHMIEGGRWMSIRWQRASDGGVVSILSDITERKQAEAALLASEERERLAHSRLLDAIESLRGGFMLWDKDERLVLFNQATFGMIYSGTWQPPLGIAFPDYVAELIDHGEIGDADARHPDLVREATEWQSDGMSGSIEYRLEDGRWVLDQRRRTSEGGAVSVLTDVTALKEAQLKAEAAAAGLAEKQRQLDVAIENISQGLVFYDADQRLVLCNRHYQELFCLPDELAQPGVHLREIMEYSVRTGNYTPETATHVVESRLAAAESTERYHGWIHFADGRIIEKIFQPLPDGGAVGTFRDVTKRERTTEALIAAKDAAEAANQAKAKFLAQMSHELRTPLNAIIGFSEIIRDRAYGEAAVVRYADYAADIHSSGHHLLRLINDILHMAKAEAGLRTLTESIVNIREEAAQAVSMLDRAAHTGGVIIVTDLPSSLPRLQADRRLVLQLFLNLLSNAVKFTSPGGMITMTAGVGPSGDLMIAVDDTGVGIAAEDQAQVFEPFFQSAAPPGRLHEGTGLGLSICKDIMDLHGGSISITSEPGRGTRATLRFPITRMMAGMPAGAGSDDGWPASLRV
jgi:signal transduction histidine kinase